MTVYTATPEMCHESPHSSDGGLLPFEWVGKKFRLLDGRALLADVRESEITAWYIRDELAEKVKALVASEETPVYTATPEMCHTTHGYGTNLLPSEWVGKKFLLRDDNMLVFLADGEESPITSWHIDGELAGKIKASVEPKETSTKEAEPDIAQQLRDELQRLREVVTAKEEELRTFKRRVGEVAMEYADRHDWCDTVAEALEEMGVEVPTKEYEFTLSVVYRVRGTKETYGEPDTYDLRNAYLDTDVTLSPDGWGDLDVEYVQHDVMDIEEVRE